MYCVIYATYLLIYYKLTKCQLKASYILLYFVSAVIGTYILDGIYVMSDPIFLLLFSYLTNKSYSRAQHILYTFYAITIVRLISRFMGYVAIPTIFHASTAITSNNPYFIVLSYLLVYPFSRLVHFLLQIDYIAVKQANQPTTRNDLRVFNIGMIIFYVAVSLTIFLQYHIPSIAPLVARIRYLMIAGYILIFLWSLHQIIKYSRRFVDDKIYEERQNHLTNLNNYNQYVNSLYEEIRRFKVETRESLEKMGPSIASEDIEQLKNDYQTLFINNKQPKQSERYALDRLVNIKIATIKSLLAAKLFKANELGLTSNVEIPDQIDKIPMNIIDFIVILSVFVDNAIEAACDSAEKTIDLVLFYNDEKLYLIVRNSSKENQVAISNVFKEGFSTKGRNRGLGLSNVKKILDQYSSIELSTKSKNHQFTQELIATLK
ncbi:GHKL domain-containing protein [Streptococcus hongkongensis]